jgi:hypothetical protein
MVPVTVDQWRRSQSFVITYYDPFVFVLFRWVENPTMLE